jgi:hypothetical protein
VNPEFSFFPTCNFSLLFTGNYVILIKSTKGTWMQKLDTRSQPKRSIKQGGVGGQKLAEIIL